MILMNKLKVLKRRETVLEAELKGYDTTTDAELSQNSRELSNLTTMGDLKTTILNSLTGPFSFSEFSLNPLMAATNSHATQV